MMDQKIRIGIELLGAALVLGLMASLLLFPAPMGINVTLWIGAVAATTLWLSMRHAGPLAGPDRWWIVPVVMFAAGYGWRDSVMLWLVRNLALMGIIVWVIGRAQLLQLVEQGVFDASLRLIRPALLAAFNLPAFAWRTIDQATSESEDRSRTMVSVGRGVLLAMPAVVVFGALLVSADAVFEQVIGDLMQFDEDDLVHVFLFVAGTWMAGGLLYGVLTSFPRLSKADVDTDRPRFRLGMVEALVVLGLIDALFASFMLVQLGYFFGGAEHVVTQEGLTMAAYARRGFFELVTVAALALPLLLVASRVVQPATDRERSLFRLFAGITVGLLVLLLLSAAQRMWLYSDAYGLTELRLYVSIFLLWLLVVLGWFGATVLRDRAERFAPVAFGAALVLAAALHVLNPEAFIVRTNVARALEGKPFDARYAASLSGDAMPELLESLPRLRPAYRQTIAMTLLRRATQDRPADWRTWNGSRARAERAIEREHARLVHYASGTPGR